MLLWSAVVLSLLSPQRMGCLQRELQSVTSKSGVWKRMLGNMRGCLEHKGGTA